ncbi:MAG: hypothetical protein ACRCTQ_03415 [Brevinemataceae bacterium]
MKMSPIRKKLWDHFYAVIITDILISKKIVSPTLKKIFHQSKSSLQYFSIIEDLKLFFNCADPQHLCTIIEQIFKESTIDTTEHSHFKKILSLLHKEEKAYN